MLGLNPILFSGRLPSFASSRHYRSLFWPTPTRTGARMMPLQSVWRHGSLFVSAFRSNAKYVRLDWLPSFSRSSFPRCLRMDSVHFAGLLKIAHIKILSTIAVSCLRLHATPLPNLRYAHAPVRQSAH